MNRHTGAPLSGWPAVQQSIEVILTTPIGSRVMRREFGSELMEIIDRPMNSQVLLALYAATADAIARWEPRFRLTGVNINRADQSGRAELVLRGEYLGETVDGTIQIGG